MTYYSGAGRKTRYYFARYVDQLYQSTNISSLPRRTITTENSITGKQQAIKVQSISKGEASQAVHPQNIETLLGVMMLRSREITTQVSAEISRGQKLSSYLKSPTVGGESSSFQDIYVVKNSINAADVLLSVTSNVLIRNYFQKRQTNNPSIEEVSLHYAFLSITTWICSILSSMPQHEKQSATETNLLLEKLLELTHRSTELLLPLPLPTYRNIAGRIAQYYDDDSGGVALVLLDLYVQAEHSSENSTPTSTMENHIFAESFFFLSPLQELIKRRKYLDAVRILEGMIQFKVSHLLEPSLGLQLLVLIKETVGETPQDAPTDAHNLKMLVDLIEKPIRRELHSAENSVKDFIDRLGLVQLDENEDEDDEDEDDEIEIDNISDSTLEEEMEEAWATLEELNSDNEFPSDDTDSEESFVQRHEALLKQDVDKLNALFVLSQGHGKYDDERTKEEAIQVAASIISKVRQLRQVPQNVTTDFNADLLSSKASTDSFTLDIDGQESITRRLQKLREEILSDAVYVRDHDIWDLHIPDVTAQLAAVKKNRDLRFTQDYEDSLVREIVMDELDKVDSNLYHLVRDDNNDDDYPGDFSDDDDDDNDDDGRN